MAQLPVEACGYICINICMRYHIDLLGAEHTAIGVNKMGYDTADYKQMRTMRSRTRCITCM
eukprot:6183274-Heterocapsa_arctica.AAC.1